MRHPATTAGLTLTEMLVATIVFLVGFVAVFGLFLGGMRFRKLSEDTTRAALAASCIVEEIRIGDTPAVPGPSAPKPPGEYVGRGFPDIIGDANIHDGAAALYPYPATPGIWYRVLSAKSLDPTDPGNITYDKSTVLEMRILVVPYASSDDTMTFAELAKRLGIKTIATTPLPSTSVTVDQYAQELVARGLGIVTDAVIVRRPSWLP